MSGAGTLAEIAGMTPLEYAGWVRHIEQWPPGDVLLQRVLAAIWALLASFIIGKPHSPLQVAPWLEDPDERRRRLAEEKRIRLVAQARMVRDLHRQRKAEQAAKRLDRLEAGVVGDQPVADVVANGADGPG